MEELKHEPTVSEVSMGSKNKHGKKSTPPSRKIVVVAVAFIVGLAIVGAIAFFYIDDRNQWIYTDNAFVEGRIYTLSAQIPGRIEKIHVSEGDRVEKGDKVASLDSTLQGLTVRKIEAAIRANSQTVKSLGILLPRASPELEIARAKRDELTIMLEEAQFVYRKTRIVSPSDGYVANMQVEHGEYVMPGQALMSVVNLDDLWIMANFMESQIKHIKIGQEVGIYVDAYPGYSLRGRVESIMPAGGGAFSLFPPDATAANWVRTAQRIPVKIALEENTNTLDIQLRIGMLAEVRVKR